MKKLITLSTLGLILGNLASTYIGPSLLGYWYAPPVQLAVNCTDSINWAMKRLIYLQLIGSVVGMLLGFAVSLFFFKKNKPDAAPAA